MPSETIIRWVFKPLVFALCLLPVGLFLWDGFNGQLSANPVEDATFATGDWALRFLLITLAVTPLRRVTGWSWLIRFRRMLGLYAFFYSFVHLLIYLWLDQSFLVGEIVADVIKRPFITVGFLAFVLLIPLALTSTKGMMRRLKRRWGQLHQAVYAIAILGVVHFWWLVKADIREPAIYGGALAVLLGYRVAVALKKRRTAAGMSPKPVKRSGRAAPVSAPQGAICSSNR